jgi:hypothetical protein
MRQQQVALFLVRNPSSLHHPSEIAKCLLLREKIVHLAINKLRKRLGDINPEALCPFCLTHSRFQGACQKCGKIIEDPLQTFRSFQTLQNSAVMNKIQSQETRPPIKVDVRTRDFLKGDRAERLKSYILSRLEQIFKKYSPDHFVTNEAALIAIKQIDISCNKHDRITPQHKLAIMISVIRECERKMPHLQRMWEEMVESLLEMPEVILYAE